jgi:hypothetical protein
MPSGNSQIQTMTPYIVKTHNPAIDLAPFGRWTLVISTFLNVCFPIPARSAKGTILS